MTATPAAATPAGPGAPPPEDQVQPLVPDTDTVWDEFLPIYASMAIPGPLRRGYTPPEVDAMEIPIVGALSRVGPRQRTVEEEAVDMLRQRMEWEALPEEVKARTPPPDW